VSKVLNAAYNRQFGIMAADVNANGRTECF
jgi:hypothetical protein